MSLPAATRSAAEHTRSTELLAARSLSIGYQGEHGVVQVLSNVDFGLEANRIVGLAGESGSGKSTLALSLAGYRSTRMVRLTGSVEYGGKAISTAPLREMRRIWGAEVAYLPQDTSTALNPALRVGSQLVEAIRLHRRVSRAEARRQGADLLARVGIPAPDQALHKYPHQFSGGQQQRVALAVALAPGPSVLVLDEPTTGLDVSIQAVVNELIVSLVRERGMATLYVSHNLALLATVCDELRIMYCGQVVESGPVADVYFRPQHPYTRALIEAVPTIARPTRPRGIPGTPPPSVVLERCSFAERCAYRSSACLHPVPLFGTESAHSVRCVLAAPAGSGASGPGVGTEAGGGHRDDAPTAGSLVRGREPVAGKDLAVGGGALLDVASLSVTYGQGRRAHAALQDVTFSVREGEVLGIVGESGSGKSTLARTVVGLLSPSRGQVLFRGAPLAPTCAARPPAVLQAVQIVFQNPDASLNPRQTVRAILDHPLRKFMGHLPSDERRRRRAEVVDRLRLPARVEERYPRELSGGQRQRVALARALVAQPVLLLCDEVTSALDVSVQASILELLRELTEVYSLTMLFVTHDLGVLRSIAGRALVLEGGRVREEGDVATVLTKPQHGYTRSLIASVPDPARALAGAPVGDGPAGSTPTPHGLMSRDLQAKGKPY